jgi:hypothetical protein
MTRRHVVGRLPGDKQAFLRHICSTHRRYPNRFRSDPTIMNCSHPGLQICGIIFNRVLRLFF